MEMIRNNSAHPGFLPGLKVFAKTVVATGGPFNYTVETGCKYIISVVAYAGTTLISPTISDSTTYVGTKTVVIAVPSGGTMRYIIIGSNEVDNAPGAISGATSVVDFDTI